MSAGRYAGSGPLTYTSPTGATVQYLAARILPLGSSVAGTQTTTVAPAEVDRLDLVAHRTLASAELGWQMADANDAMDPFELCTRPGDPLALPRGGAGTP